MARSAGRRTVLGCAPIVCEPTPHAHPSACPSGAATSAPPSKLFEKPPRAQRENFFALASARTPPRQMSVYKQIRAELDAKAAAAADPRAVLAEILAASELRLRKMAVADGTAGLGAAPEAAADRRLLARSYSTPMSTPALSGEEGEQPSGEMGGRHPRPT